MKTVVTLEFNHFDEIAAKLPDAVAQVVETSAFVIEGEAKVLAPVDTGNLRASYQTEKTRPDGTQFLVGTNVEYAPFVEFGTSKMAAQAHLTPAAEQERPNFIRDMSNLEDSLR